MITSCQQITEDIILWSQSLLDEQWGVLSAKQRESIYYIMESAQDFLHLWMGYYNDGMAQTKLASVLRDPLTVIMGYSMMLHDGMTGNLTEMQRDYAKRIYRASAVLQGELDMLYFAGIIS